MSRQQRLLASQVRVDIVLIAVPHFLFSAFVQPETFRILDSKLAGAECFSATLSPRANTVLHVVGKSSIPVDHAIMHGSLLTPCTAMLGKLFEDLPQLIIQILVYVHTQNSARITVVTIVSSVLSIAYGTVFYGLMSYIAHWQHKRGGRASTVIMEFPFWRNTSSRSSSAGVSVGALICSSARHRSHLYCRAADPS